MGGKESFPGVLEYSVGAVADGWLRYHEDDRTRVGEDTDAAVIPFAQRGLIHTLISGIHPEVLRGCVQHAVDVGLREGSGKRKTKAKHKTKHKAETKAKTALERALVSELQETVIDAHVQPVLAGVASLPRGDLARLAEALVQITAMMNRITADEETTVTAPVDVALLSRGEGFVWCRRKRLGMSTEAQEPV